MSLLSKEMKDFTLLVALQGLNYVAPLVVFPYLMKVLGAEHFGYIGFSLTVAQYFMLIVDFGFNLSATKRIAQATDPNERSRIFTATLTAKSILLLISFVILLLLMSIGRFEVYRPTMLILFLMTVANAYFFIWFFQGIGKIKLISIINVISKLLIFPFTFIYVKGPDDVLAAAYILSLVYLLGTLINIVLVVKGRMVRLTRVSVAIVKQEVRESFPIFLSTASTSFYTSMFVVLLGVMSTPVVVGLYTSAEKLMRSVCFLFLTPLIQLFYPKLATMAVENKAGAHALFYQIFRITIPVVFLLMMILWFMSEPITAFLGSEYAAASEYFQLMLLALLAIPAGGLAGQLGLLAIGDDVSKRRYRKVYLVAAPVSLLFLSVLTYQFGGIGAVVALVLTEYFVAAMMLYYLKKITL